WFRCRPRWHPDGIARGPRLDRRPGAPRATADRDPVLESRLQPGIRLLPRGEPRQPGTDPSRVCAQADLGQWRAVYHAGAQGKRNAGAEREERDGGTRARTL